MDEPTTALDLYYKESIQVWMRQYLKGNGTVIMTTHDEGEIAQSDRCLLMKDGVLSEVDKTDVRRALQ
jgi:ABC-2 type transport system ATP-binding protein